MGSSNTYKPTFPWNLLCGIGPMFELVWILKGLQSRVCAIAPILTTSPTYGPTQRHILTRHVAIAPLMWSNSRYKEIWNIFVAGGSSPSQILFSQLKQLAHPQNLLRFNGFSFPVEREKSTYIGRRSSRQRSNQTHHWYCDNWKHMFFGFSICFSCLRSAPFVRAPKKWPWVGALWTLQLFNFLKFLLPMPASLYTACCVRIFHMQLLANTCSTCQRIMCFHLPINTFDRHTHTHSHACTYKHTCGDTCIHLHTQHEYVYCRYLFGTVWFPAADEKTYVQTGCALGCWPASSKHAGRGSDQAPLHAQVRGDD